MIAQRLYHQNWNLFHMKFIEEVYGKKNLKKSIGQKEVIVIFLKDHIHIIKFVG